MNRWMHAAGYATVVLVMSAGAAQGLAGSNTVASDDIINGAVTTPDLRDRAVTGAKVLDGSLTGTDIAAGSVGLSRLGGTWTAAVRTTLYGNISGFAYAPCPSGRTAISGSSLAGSSAANVVSSVPQSDGWLVTYRNWYASDTWIEVSALCVRK